MDVSPDESWTCTEGWLFFSMLVLAGPYSPHRLSRGKTRREKSNRVNMRSYSHWAMKVSGSERETILDLSIIRGRRFRILPLITPLSSPGMACISVRLLRVKYSSQVALASSLSQKMLHSSVNAVTFFTSAVLAHVLNI